MRNPRRTSSTAAALMIGVALVTLASVFFTSLKASFGHIVDRSFGGDFVISNQNQRSGVPLAVIDQLRQKKEIGNVAAIQYLDVSKVNGNNVDASAVEPKSFNKIMDIEVQQGNLDQMSNSEIGVSKKYADQHNLKLGDSLNFQSLVTSTDRKISVIYKDTTLAGSFLITSDSIKADNLRTDSMLFLDKASGFSAAQTRTAVKSVTDSYVTLKVQDQTELKKDVTKSINNILHLFYVLLGLAIVIALIGITNTLALSVFERTRELGLLRAVGMTRRQTRSMVRWESVIVAVLGTVLGLIIGIAFGAALVHSAKSEGIEVLAIPWLTVLIELVVAAIAGILAALLPARRAARIDVLKAIATD